MRGQGWGEAGASRALAPYTPTQGLPGLTSVPFLVTMLWPRTPQRKGRGDDTAGAGSGGLTRRRGAAVMASPLSAATVKRVTRGVPGWGRVGGAALAASGSACSTTPEQALGSRPNRRTAVRSWLCARAQDGERADAKPRHALRRESASRRADSRRPPAGRQADRGPGEEAALTRQCGGRGGSPPPGMLLAPAPETRRPQRPLRPEAPGTRRCCWRSRSHLVHASPPVSWGLRPCLRQ